MCSVSHLLGSHIICELTSLLTPFQLSMPRSPTMPWLTLQCFWGADRPSKEAWFKAVQWFLRISQEKQGPKIIQFKCMLTARQRCAGMPRDPRVCVPSVALTGHSIFTPFLSVNSMLLRTSILLIPRTPGRKCPGYFSSLTLIFMNIVASQRRGGFCCTAQGAGCMYEHIPSCLHPFPSQATSEHWAELSELYSRFSSLIHFIHGISSVHTYFFHSARKTDAQRDEGILLWLIVWASWS